MVDAPKSSNPIVAFCGAVKARTAGASDPGAQTTQYGLIAEEVAEVAPELVAPDLEGRPYSVKYHELPALLLNEMKKQQQTIQGQAGVIETQRQENQAQHREIAALTTRLAQLEARVISAPGDVQR